MRRTAWSCAAALLLVSLAGCGGDDDSAAGNRVRRERPTTTTTIVTTTTVALTPEQEVEAAYLKSWDVYTRAVRTFDESELATVYAEHELDTKLAEVQRLRADETPVKCRVDHDYSIAIVEPERALLRDRLVNHCVLLNRSGQPAEPDPNTSEDVSFTLKRIGGTWKVVFSLEFSE